MSDAARAVSVGPAFGSFRTVVLENDDVRLVLCPEIGARVLSLVDLRTDREWLVQGQAPPALDAWSGESAIFGGAEAFGWDECFPTIAPCPDPLDPGGRPLRDHGDLWGRPVTVRTVGSAVVAEWRPSRWPYRFARTLRLDGRTVVASYELQSHGDRALPFLWAQHALLALEPGATISAGPDTPVRLAEGLPDDTAGIAAKHAVRPGGDPVRAVQPDGATLAVTWDRTFAPWLGIWLDEGGWPPAAPVRQHALEPATAPDADLEAAMAAGRASSIEPGQTLRWEVRISLA